jgi:hypothetical protein
MQFISNFFNFGNSNIKKFEKQAKDILELPKNFKAYRLEKDVVVVNTSSNKIIQRTKDTLPTNHTRATLELIRRMNLVDKKSDVWTCGFRDNEARWVWYKNSQPKITVSFSEAFTKEDFEDKIFFYSARYGTSIIDQIKKDGLEKVAKDINAFVLENPYIKVKCCSCDYEENYTIDDLVDQNKNPKYSSNYVVCQNCNELVKL